MTLETPLASTANPTLSFLELLPEYGSSTSALRVTLPDGRVLPIFTERSLAEHAGVAEDPNAPFKLWNTPLFPLANRLRGAGREDTPVRAEIAGQPVSMPRNHRDCHLHGLLYARQPLSPPARADGSIRSRYSGFFDGYWTSDAEVEIEHALRNGAFHYRMRARNIGSTPMPVGFGSHPYFEAPSGDATALRLLVPARKFAEIDNLDDVFPTGKLLEVPGSDLDFARVPRIVANRFLDNFWTDLVPDEDGFPYAELHDLRENLRIRMTSTTPNVKGAQVYYPRKGTSIAIELVTHLPDPRPEIWNGLDTGMTLLQPGESAEYGFKIEVFRLF